MARMLEKHEEVEADVTWEDQKKINLFGKYNGRLSELKDELKLKLKERDDLKDAADEIMLADDDGVSVKYRVGELLVDSSQDEATEYVEAAQARNNSEISTIESEIKKIQGMLGEVKVQLYAKFGRSINLDIDDE
eukprot:Colp12_sorted_trinity150504_noHs@15295